MILFAGGEGEEVAIVTAMKAPLAAGPPSAGSLLSSRRRVGQRCEKQDEEGKFDIAVSEIISPEVGIERIPVP